jgi:hypothetical protein
LFCRVQHKHKVLPTISFMSSLGIKFISFTGCIPSHQFFSASCSSSVKDYCFGHDYFIAFTIQPISVDQSEKISQTPKMSRRLRSR